MKRTHLVATALLAICASTCSPALAYEADVHFGLTRWLALRAGFSEPEADAIALGDQRMDNGLVETTTLNLEYACAGHFPEVARQAQHRHYPSATSLPALPDARPVRPGDASTRVDLDAVTRAAKGKEGAMLGKLGEALHPWQDAWAHQGIPAMPVSGAVACDSLLVSGHPVARGGPASHDADITAAWPDEALAMARATYDELVRYGPINARPRTAAAWTSLIEPVTAFSRARTKSDKRAWFVAQGMPDTRFLEGISLPDGAAPGPLDWPWRKLPPAPGEASMQHDAPVDVRAFFDRLLARWLGGEPIDRVVADMGSATGRDELVARLRLWKLRDHGRAAELAHAGAPLKPAQRKAAERLARDPAWLLPPAAVTDALLPLQPSTAAPMPMLPYIVVALPPVSGRERSVALGRLRHAPYDTLGWVAERQGGRWVLIEVVATVDP